MALPDKDVMCHHTGFTRQCRDIIVNCTCPKYAKIVGFDPNTGKEIEFEGCVDTMLPKIMIEQAQKMYMMSASVESMRNEIVMRMDEQKARHYDERDKMIALGLLPDFGQMKDIPVTLLNGEKK